MWDGLLTYSRTETIWHVEEDFWNAQLYLNRCGSWVNSSFWCGFYILQETKKKKTKEDILVLVCTVGSGSFRYLHRTGSSQVETFLFWCLSSWHPTPSQSRMCSSSPSLQLSREWLHSALPSQCYKWQNFPQLSYNKCTCPVFCSIQDSLFSAFKYNSDNTTKSVSGIRFLWPSST